ncbi:hypothetical protein [Aurantiacibacter gilvus]|uniref:Cysteine-rich CPCC domain-containing protein n=1 Tax=Aurantiacibacter gilvus TaxID=3139141 RepID=A0ABU9IEZ1_9SPHN
MSFDYRSLNIQSKTGDWLCPSCGFPGYFRGLSFVEGGPLIGTGICPCCTYEPGFDDVAAASGTPHSEPIDALRAYSKEWFAGGMRWWGNLAPIPGDWSPEKQAEGWKLHCKPILK